MMFWMRRPLWKNGLGLILFLLGSFLLFTLIRSILPFLPPLSDLNFGLSYLAPLLATILLTKFFDHMPPAWSGLGFHRWMGREIGWGIAIGLGMVVLAWIPVALTGSVEMGTITPTFLLLMFRLLVNAAGEEIVFRGYPFQRIVEMIGPAAGTILLSALFAAAHLGNPNISEIAVVNTFLAGLLFSASRLTSGSLWMPIALHGTWNIALALFAGLPMSGMTFGTSLLNTTAAGPEYLTGGPFGPEGSIVTTGVLLLGLAALFRLPTSEFSPYTFSRIFRGVYRQNLRKFGEEKLRKNSSHIRSVS